MFVLVSTDVSKGSEEENISSSSLESYAFNLAKAIEMDAKMSLFGEEVMHPTPAPAIAGNSGTSRGGRNHLIQKQKIVLQSIDEGLV